VGTVDSFQGQERDIIAITLTRSNPQGEIGFLSDIRRMNVGMTRARRKLLLVGDSSTLCRHPFFVVLLAYVKGVGGYRTAREMVKQTWINDGAFLIGYAMHFKTLFFYAIIKRYLLRSWWPFQATLA
jgi:superfamily I DNA and/or RNA helicase